jgi:hypothetical protein
MLDILRPHVLLPKVKMVFILDAISLSGFHHNKYLSSLIQTDLIRGAIRDKILWK